MESVVIVGAGVGGLSCAAILASRGLDVTLVERAEHVGGKLRAERVGDHAVDAGPTVLTMRHALESVFDEAGARLADHLTLRPLEVLARHHWPDGSSLDLFADEERSAEAIASFSSAAEARAYLAFSRYARRIYDIVREPFMEAQRPTMTAMLARAGRLGPKAMIEIDAHRTMHAALASFFRDPRLLQLFGRYATYCGSSPFTAPATLNVISHVERMGVFAVEGGMRSIADALHRIATLAGAKTLLSTHVEEIVVEKGRVAGVRIAGGAVLPADFVVHNGDVMAIRRGLLGPAAKLSVPETKNTSLSALTVAATARAAGSPLERHNVFFSRDYDREFRDLERGVVPADPSIYLCAQDRVTSADAPSGAERMLFIVNAPTTRRGAAPVLEDAWLNGMWEKLRSYGCEITPEAAVVTTPERFAARFPGTDGAIYGPASVGMWSSFARSEARSTLPGLYVAGGSVHPGAGIPMAATSGRLAASALLEDSGSTERHRATGTLGGTWMR